MWAEGFDSHEPFEVPGECLDMYEDDYQEPELYWPDYNELMHIPLLIYHPQVKPRRIEALTQNIGVFSRHCWNTSS